MKEGHFLCCGCGIKCPRQTDLCRVCVLFRETLTLLQCFTTGSVNNYVLDFAGGSIYDLLEVGPKKESN